MDHLAGGHDLFGPVGSGHHEIALGRHAGRGSGEAVLGQLDLHFPTQGCGVIGRGGDNSVEGGEPTVEVEQPRAEQRLPVDLVIGMPIARGCDLGDLRWERVGSDIEAHADHHPARAVSFGENSRELAVIDHEIVRPLEARLEPGDFIDRFRGGDAGCERHEVQTFGREVGAQKNRHQERGTGRGDPGATVATAPRGLLVGDGNHALATTLHGLEQEVPIRRVDAGEPADLVEPGGGEPTFHIGCRPPGGVGIGHHP